MKAKPSQPTKSRWLPDEPITVTATRNKLHDVASKIHRFCLTDRYSVDHPLVGFKLHESISAAFPNTPGEILSEYARRASGELRAKLLHYR